MNVVYLWFNFSQNISENLKERYRIKRIKRDQVVTFVERLLVQLLNYVFELLTHLHSASGKDRNHFDKFWQEHVYNTRSNNNAYIVPRTKGTAQFNFNVIGGKEWNNLPSRIKLSPSKDSYKKSVKAYLRAQAHSSENDNFVYY
jgi:hypothetical protein